MYEDIFDSLAENDNLFDESVFTEGQSIDDSVLPDVTNVEMSDSEVDPSTVNESDDDHNLEVESTDEEPAPTTSDEIQLEAGDGNQEDEEVQEPLEVSHPSNTDWIIHLKNRDSFVMEEFGETYQFEKVVTPAGVATDKFMVFNKKSNDAQNNWVIMNGLLSGRYAVAATDIFTQQLLNQINTPNTPDVRTGDFKVSWMIDTVNPIPVFDSDAEKYIISIVTGIGIEDLNSLGTFLTFQVTNSFDGKARLRFDYILSSAVQTDDNKFRNYFAMGKHSERLVHSCNIVNMQTENLIENIQDTVAALRATPIQDSVVNNKILFHLKKNSKSLWDACWGGLADDQKSLYNATLLASLLLDKDWSISTLYKLRSVFGKLTARI